MRFKILALRDIKADQYEAPMFVANTNVAIRDLRDMINEKDPKYTWQRHPEDYELRELGVWDNQTAEFDLNETQLCALSTLKE